MFTPKLPKSDLPTLELKDEYVVDFEANIEIFPPQHPDEKVEKGTYICVGDLHGNALKLIYILVRHQIINMDEATYNSLVAMYKFPLPTTPEELAPFKDNLMRFINTIADCFESSDPNLVGKVKLMGDLFADRGLNDAYTFILIYCLTRIKDVNNESFVRVIIASNHDNIALLKLLHDIDSYTSSPHRAEIIQSLLNMTAMMDKGLGHKKFIVDKVIKEHYLPHLKVIAYSEYYDDAGKLHIDIFTHAPTFFLFYLQEALRYYELDLKLDGTKATLFKIIDAINEEFKLISGGVILPDDPLNHFIWDRGLSERLITPENARYFLPAVYDGAIMHYHHGHDMLEMKCEDKTLTKKRIFEKYLAKSALPHMTGYDNLLGKTSDPTGIYFTKKMRENRDLRLDTEDKPSGPITKLSQ